MTRCPLPGIAGRLLTGSALLFLLTGCSSGTETKSTEEMQAFAPGMKNLSPEARALRAQNERQMSSRQAAAATENHTKPNP